MRCNNKIYLILPILIFTIFLQSCGPKLGYGIVLWSNQEESLPSGTMVKVLAESQINGSYTVQAMDSKEKYEITTWRVELLEENPDPEQAVEDYQAWAQVYSRCLKNGLPMRSEPDHEVNNTVYKLQENQEVKILDRLDEMTTIGDLEGYWYKLLTHDGVVGWCFDYYLQIYSLDENQQPQIQNDREEEDPLLEAMLNVPFYPSATGDMIAANRVDLSRISSSHFFYIDEENQRVRVTTPDHQVEAIYESIASTGYHKYSFIGTSFQLEAYSAEIISLQYNYQGKDYKEGFVQLEEPLDITLAAETERRNGLTMEMVDKGPGYSSDTYGTIEFFDNGSFSWVDKSLLISRNLISAEAGNQGRFRFSVFPGSSIAGNYRGVISLHFNSGERLDFLYTWKPSGVLFLLVPSQFIEKNLVETDSFRDPLQIFFRTQETQ